LIILLEATDEEGETNKGCARLYTAQEFVAVPVWLFLKVEAASRILEAMTTIVHALVDVVRDEQFRHFVQALFVAILGAPVRVLVHLSRLQVYAQCAHGVVLAIAAPEILKLGDLVQNVASILDPVQNLLTTVVFGIFVVMPRRSALADLARRKAKQSEHDESEGCLRQPRHRVPQTRTI